MSIIYSTVCEVLGGRARTADDRQFLDSATIIPEVITLQWYYREILPIPTVITAVTAVLPHSPLPCHSLIQPSPQTSLYTITTSRVAIKWLLLGWVTGCGQANHLDTTHHQRQLSLPSLRGR